MASVPAWIDVRDGLMLSNREWKLLAKTANRTADLPGTRRQQTATGDSIAAGQATLSLEQSTHRHGSQQASCREPV